MITISEACKKSLQKAVKYDRITIYQIGDKAIAEFFWEGELMITLSTRCTFAENQQLNLIGLEGSLGYRVD